jgi:hypothetical protein
MSDSQRKSAFVAKARSIANSSVTLKRSGTVIEEIDNNRYRLIPDATEDQPLLTYTAYFARFASTQVTLDLFPDSRIQATWGQLTTLRGTYEGRIDESEMQHLLDLVIQSGLAEPGGLVNTENLPVPLDSGSISLRLHAKSLSIADLGEERQLSPYDSNISTPSLPNCDKSSGDVSVIVICRIDELQDDLFQLALSLARGMAK